MLSKVNQSDRSDRIQASNWQIRVSNDQSMKNKTILLWSGFWSSHFSRTESVLMKNNSKLMINEIPNIIYRQENIQNSFRYSQVDFRKVFVIKSRFWRHFVVRTSRKSNPVTNSMSGDLRVSKLSISIDKSGRKPGNQAWTVTWRMATLFSVRHYRLRSWALWRRVSSPFLGL